MNICNYIANYLIRKNVILADDKDVYAYGLFVILYNSFLIFDILLLAMLLHQLEFAIIFLLFWTPYRILIGGSHCSTAIKCWAFFNFYYILSYIIYFNIPLMTLVILNIVTMIIQCYKKLNNKFFIILWGIYFILIYFINTKYQTIISISYLMNSILTLHQMLSKRKYIF